MYGSLQDAGVGGLKTGLPAWRDGFTPQQTDLGRYLFFAPLLSADELQEIGFAAAVWPVTGLFAITKALQEAYGILKRDGTSKGAHPNMVDFQAFTDLVGLPALRDSEEEYLRFARDYLANRDQAAE